MQIILVVTNDYICVEGNLPVYLEETHLCMLRKPTCVCGGNPPVYPEEIHLSVPGGNPPLTLCP